MGNINWDDALGLTKLPLQYPAHARGIEGENFNYSVYFTDGIADEEKAEAVRRAISAYDFQIVGDVYIGYLNVSAGDNCVSIFLDLGNTEPQNENRILNGILLALNDVPGIREVIINEDCEDFDF